MKIHLQSDTHVEMGTAMTPSNASNVVVCAGDIGTVKGLSHIERHFARLKETTDHIIWVLGNHEFYHGEYQQVLDTAAEFAQKHGIHLLDEALGTEDLVLDGVTFWGSTLWTDLNNGDYFAMGRVGDGFNDFACVTNGARQFTAQDTIDINKRTREKINWDADVIITHHCPILMQHRRFPMSDFSYGFCNTGLEEQIMDSKAKYWLYGHTHDSRSVSLNGTLVLSNQQGYPRGFNLQSGERSYEDPFFDPGLIIEV